MVIKKKDYIVAGLTWNADVTRELRSAEHSTYKNHNNNSIVIDIFKDSFPNDGVDFHYKCRHNVTKNWVSTLDLKSTFVFQTKQIDWFFAYETFFCLYLVVMARVYEVRKNESLLTTVNSLKSTKISHKTKAITTETSVFFLKFFFNCCLLISVLILCSFLWSFSLVGNYSTERPFLNKMNNQNH